MKQVYYSELLKKYFDTEKEATEAEDAYNKAHAEELKRAEEKKARANEVDQAYTDYVNVCKECNSKIKESYKKYLDLRNQFIKDYNTKYHASYDIIEVFDDFFNRLF